MRSDPVGSGLWMPGPQFRERGAVSGGLGGVALLEKYVMGRGQLPRRLYALLEFQKGALSLLLLTSLPPAMLSLPLWN